MPIQYPDKEAPEYVGRVLTSEWRSAGFGDSDRYALVYEGEGDNIEFRWVSIDTTRFAPSNAAAIPDAPAEIQALYKQRQREAHEREQARWRDAQEHTPEKGKLAIVVRGKKHIGSWGRITWVGPNKFARHWQRGPVTMSLRIQSDTGEGFFVTGEKVDVIVEPIEAGV